MDSVAVTPEPSDSGSATTGTSRNLGTGPVAGSNVEQPIVARPNTAGVRVLPMDELLTATVTIRKGSIEKRSRGGTLRTVQFKVSEGYEVLRAKVERLFDHPTFNSMKRNDDQIYFRQSKGASQHQFAVLTSANFIELLHQRWKRISAGDRMQWGDNIANNFAFEMFIYCHPIAPQAPTIHRATAARIRQATERIREYQRETGVALGPITMSHVTITLARQADMDNFTFPSDNTTRQAIALGEVRETMDEARRSQHPLQKAEIKLRVNGSWVAYEVDVLSLRAALGLPAHDIFTEGIFHGYQPVPPPAVDLADSDHVSDEDEQLAE